MFIQMSAGALGSPPLYEYKGSVTRQKNSRGGWDDPSQRIDVLSLASPGDLVVFAFSFAVGAVLDGITGMPFAALYNNTDQENPGAYAGYRVVQGSDGDPYINGGGFTGFWSPSVITAAVFDLKGHSVLSVSSAVATGSSGMPNPPSLTASGNLGLIIGHLDDDAIASSVTEPSGFILAAAHDHTASGNSASTMMAYRAKDHASLAPGAFGGTGTDTWRASTISFDIG